MLYTPLKSKGGVAPDVFRLLRKSSFNNDLYLRDLGLLSPEEQREKVEKDLAAAERRVKRRAAKVKRRVRVPMTDEERLHDLLTLWAKASSEVRAKFMDECQ
jgi:hypothetical protein